MPKLLTGLCVCVCVRACVRAWMSSERQIVQFSSYTSSPVTAASGYGDTSVNFGDG